MMVPSQHLCGQNSLYCLDEPCPPPQLHFGWFCALALAKTYLFCRLGHHWLPILQKQASKTNYFSVLWVASFSNNIASVAYVSSFNLRHPPHLLNVEWIIQSRWLNVCRFEQLSRFWVTTNQETDQFLGMGAEVEWEKMDFLPLLRPAIIGFGLGVLFIYFSL